MKIGEDMPVYPGNPEPEIKQYRKIPEDSTTESEIDIGSHTGTHVDAPMHVFEGGEDVTDLELENFYGECRVLDLTGCGDSVDAEDLDQDLLDAEIILLKTENSEKQRNSFREDFTYLTLEAAEKLKRKNVETVGIDYLSLVEFEGGEKAEEAHKFANKEMNVIEGLDLSEAEGGKYVFAGFPIKISIDGAPMRAVLIEK